MATDGVKIVDGDYAYDIYYTFMDLFDAGHTPAFIAEKLAELRIDNDDFDEEIFITTYALALWETGWLTPEVLLKVEEAIAKNAFAKYLIEKEQKPVLARSRQQVLERFWLKINQPNLKIKKPKKPTVSKTLIFNEDDVLVFQLPDEQYCATILMQINQRRNQPIYQFLIVTYKSITKPTIEDILASEVLARWIGGSDGPVLCFDLLITGPKTLRVYANKFECIGKIEIRSDLKRGGSYKGVSDFQDFFENWVDFKFTGNSSYPKLIGVSLKQVL
ncbi:hypothetical protein [Hymenobacter volaticus]|uniref:DUF2313 domain-containing protein n=1 Tax=Hymenobacter volaticus TaxID=2932254 RepID=A0ABY4G7S0_9BACT|nr:hypothetical protein [Hymenobacter volaticus]UOQ66887.1 hypothetical protein MUN86_02935 [Hymenobacter volaticus]